MSDYVLDQLKKENEELRKKLAEKTEECESHKRWILLIEQGEATKEPRGRDYEI